MLNILSYIDQNYQTHFRELTIEQPQSFETDDKTTEHSQSFLTKERTISANTRTISVNSGEEKEFKFDSSKNDPLI